MKCDLLFISLENWDDIWRRNQFVCAELAERYPDRKILFVGLPRDVSHGIRRGRLRELCRRATYPAPGFANITITHPLKLFPDSIGAGRIANERMFRRHVKAVADSLGMGEPMLWINAHSAAHMVGRMNESAVVYDITDDWTSFSQSPRLTQRITEQDARLCREADAVIVCSERLLEMKEALVPEGRLHSIPNGVHVEHYREVLDGTGPLPAMTQGWLRPVMGYTGTIHPDRLDVELVRRLAMTPGVGSVVLVGPNHLQGPDAEVLRLPNVFMPGPISYSELPGIMRAFDVCVVPHRVTAFTESLNPIKLWEYLAAGKPIVATDVAGFRDFPELVAIAGGGDAFVAAALAALQERPDLAEARQREAGKHSWRARVDEIEKVLEACVCKQGELAHAG